MKTITFFLFLLTITLNAWTQDPGYSGPAKAHVKAFWDTVKKLKDGAGGSADNLQRQIKLTKEKAAQHRHGLHRLAAPLYKGGRTVNSA